MIIINMFNIFNKAADTKKYIIKIYVVIFIDVMEM